MRGYTGKALKSAVLEIVVRPPTTTREKDQEATGAIDELEWNSVEKVFARVESDSAIVVEDEEESPKMHQGEDTSNNHIDKPIIIESSTDTSNASEQSTGLNKKLGMDFENVGGLDAQLDDIARRVLASRANPEAARRLGVSHVRGILLR